MQTKVEKNTSTLSPKNSERLEDVERRVSESYKYFDSSDFRLHLF